MAYMKTRSAEAMGDIPEYPIGPSNPTMSGGGRIMASRAMRAPLRQFQPMSGFWSNVSDTLSKWFSSTPTDVAIGPATVEPTLQHEDVNAQSPPPPPPKDASWWSQQSDTTKIAIGVGAVAGVILLTKKGRR